MDKVFGPSDDPRQYRLVEGRTLYIGVAELPLGPLGLRALELFLTRPTRVFAGSEIEQKVGGNNYSAHFSKNRVREIRQVLGFEAIKTSRGVGYRFNPDWRVCQAASDADLEDDPTLQTAPFALDPALAEKTYFRYRDEVVPSADTSDVSLALASRYKCKAVAIGDQVFPVTVLWQNQRDLIHPDKILGTLDYSEVSPRKNSPTLNAREYREAREFIKAIYTEGPIKYEGIDYCMNAINIDGALPRIDGRFGRYYDNILTQFALGWELKKALKKASPHAIAKGTAGILPLREAIERGGDPLYDGTLRTAAISVSMLMVFDRGEQGFWTIIHRRSKDVGVYASLLHVVPAGMFEAKNSLEKWSVQTSLWREMLEEVYDDEEQQGNGEPGFEDHITSKEPLRSLSKLLNDGRAELSLTGISCDLMTLQPEICAVLLVRNAVLTDIRPMRVNWEYEKHGRPGAFGTPWERIEAEIKEVRVGGMVPSGVACFELGRNWLRERHGF